MIDPKIGEVWGLSTPRGTVDYLVVYDASGTVIQSDALRAIRLDNMKLCGFNSPVHDELFRGVEGYQTPERVSTTLQEYLLKNRSHNV